MLVPCTWQKGQGGDSSRKSGGGVQPASQKLYLLRDQNFETLSMRGQVALWLVHSTP